MNTYHGKIIHSIIEKVVNIIGDDNMLTLKNQMESYSHDEMAEDVAIRHYPDIVVKPRTSSEISQILKLANTYRIPVTPRGAGTGLSGGAVPIFGGILLSLERLNSIIEIDEDNLMITVEAGVPLMDIFTALEKTQLFFPPHPGDESAFIGGTVATNAGGARTVKYGVIRDFVKGAEVVLPNGHVLHLGGKLMKNNTGYNLLHLMVGSEGTLGVFTQIVLRLLPRTKQSMILLLSYDNLDSAIATVPRILRSGVIPLGIEYVEKDCIIPTAKMLGKTWPADGDAFLIIIVDGNTDEELYSICEDISNIGEQNGALDALIAERKDEQETIMDIRSNIYEGLKSESIEILDVGVPPSEIAKFAKKVKDLSSRIGIPVLMYGHAGDGNIHIHPMKTGLSNNWKEKYTQTKKMIFEVGKSFGGVITAEHGVGALKINDLQYTLSADELSIMKQIKQLFDPNNIMNPGKVIPPPNKQR